MLRSTQTRAFTMMKLSTIIALLIIVVTNSYAQHFKFMGIELDGSIEKFEKKLEEKGFSPSENNAEDRNKHETFYEGMYAGHEVSLMVVTTAKTNIVCSATVFLNVKTEEKAESITTFIKNTIKEKYSIDDIKIQSPTNTRYEIQNGDIVVSYFHNDDIGCYQIYVFYVDIENNAINQKEKKEDI